MKDEVRRAVYDGELQIEAYQFKGVAQSFPNHFHTYYVVGLIEEGEGQLLCGGREYVVKKEDMLLFQPGDSHGCRQRGGGTLSYRGMNVSRERMLSLTAEASGQGTPPGFSRQVIADPELAREFRLVHEQVMRGVQGWGKEELLVFLSHLVEKYGRPFADGVPKCRKEIQEACAFMEDHLGERIDLDQICRYTGLSKATLLRAFTKEKGVTPYRYLENLRIGAAKKLLKQGVPPIEAALRTGFSDQSHFTNYFSQFIGLSPGTYREIYLKKNLGGDRPKE